MSSPQRRPNMKAGQAILRRSRSYLSSLRPVLRARFGRGAEISARALFLSKGAAHDRLVRRFQNNAPMSSGCIVDFVTPGVDDGLVIDVGNERHQALLELVFGADADVAQDRTRQL